METNAKARLVGTFLMAGFAAAVAFAVWAAHYRLNPKGVVYEIHFTQAVNGLHKRSSVYYNGVHVGGVRSIRLDPEDPAIVIVRIVIRKGLHLRTDTAAKLKSNLVTGRKKILLRGGTRDADELSVLPGQRYPVIPTERGGISAIVASVPETLANANALITRLTRLVDTNEEAITSTINNANVASARIAAASGQLDEVLAAAPPALQEVTRAATDARTLTATAGKLLSGEVAPAVQRYGALADTVGAVVQRSGDDLHQMTGHTSAGISLLLARANQTMRAVDRFVRQLRSTPESLVFGRKVPVYRPGKSK